MAVFAIDNGYFPGMRIFSTVRFEIQIADSTHSKEGAFAAFAEDRLHLAPHFDVKFPQVQKHMGFICLSTLLALVLKEAFEMK